MKMNISVETRLAIGVKAIDDAIQRHLSGDWGKITDLDRSENEWSLRENSGWTFGRYYTPNETVFFVRHHLKKDVIEVMSATEYHQPTATSQTNLKQ